ncbi:MAG: arylsulfatase [Bacteroidota bacterium]
MKNTHYFYFLLFIAIGSTTWMACESTPNSEENEIPQHQGPNIVLVMTDDQGWGDLSSHGNDSIETPVLDRLREESVHFDRFYVSPVCAPTRASLLTGRYHLRTACSWVTHRKEVMRTEEQTLAEVLKATGYRTGLFGKWHNGKQYPHDPQGQGFDEYFGFSAGHWNNFFDTKLTHNQKEIQTEGYLADVLTDAAINFIRQNQQQAFFCYVPYNTPHSPLQVADAYFDKYKAKGLSDYNAAVYGMVENIDDNMGRLLGALDSMQLRENTIVVFLTDNGPNGRRYNGGMRGIKGKVDEGGVRVPLFIRWPGGNLKHGTEVKELVAHIDLMPTLLELCNVKAPKDIQWDGRSIAPLLRGETNAWEARTLFTFPSNRYAEAYPGAVRNPHYRLVIDAQEKLSLYDMIKDPGQTQIITDDEYDRAVAMKQAYDSAYAQVTAAGVEPPLIELGHLAYDRVSLPAPEAKLHGAVKFKADMGWANDWVANWTATSDSVVWSVDVVRDGDYEIQLLYNCAEGQTGSTIAVSANGQSIQTQIEKAFMPDYLPSPDRVERWEVYEKEWKALPVGRLALERGKQELVVRATNIPAQEAMELKGLIVQRR